MRTYGVFSLALLVAGCTSFQPSESERGVAYPLDACTVKMLDEAAAHLQSTAPLKLDASWVCVTPVPKNLGSATAGQSIPASDASTAVNPGYADEELRKHVEVPFIASTDRARPRLGIALSGGGSKAGAYATGILAGMADIGLLDKADYLSSVSGGSYAAYFYYVHRIGADGLSKDVPAPSTRSLFWDCVGQLRATDTLSQPTRDSISRHGACDAGGLLAVPGPAQSSIAPDNRYQALLRCQQDVFNPGRCSGASATHLLGDNLDGTAVLESLTLFPLADVASVLFDWGVSLSPSARTYRRGIGMAYGTTVEHPEMLRYTDRTPSVELDCGGADPSHHVLGCVQDGSGVQPSALSFDQLRIGLLRAREPGQTPMPFWIINATAQRYRSLFGWLSLGSPERGNSDLFEMTAVSQGADEWGYVPAPASMQDMSVLDAVVASAAFADSNELAISNKLGKALLGVGLRVFNFDWGVDIPNYNVSDWRRHLHQTLPIPLYWTDSAIDRSVGPASRHPEMRSRQHTAFIRLIDGGNGEDLGVYPLVKRGVRAIILADSASDKHGVFDDLCALKRRLEDVDSGARRFLYIPGLANFDTHCQNLAAGDGTGYPLHAWPFDEQVLVGCLRDAANPTNGPDACAGLADDETRLVIAKPAINVRRLVDDQLSSPTPSTSGLGIVERCLVVGETTPPGTHPLLNCDSASYVVPRLSSDGHQCPEFPQDGTWTMTLSSSSEKFVAYRELGRQTITGAQGLLVELSAGYDRLFEQFARRQGQAPFTEGSDSDCHGVKN